MSDFLDFILMREPTVRWVVLGVILFSISSSLVGTFAFLRKKSLVGDAVSHSVLPGICLAFILFQSKSLAVLLAGAFITGWLSIVAIDIITTKSKLKSDTAIGLVLSVFFGMGMMLLTYIQKQGIGDQAGLSTFIFGSAASIIKQDIITFAVIAVIIVASIILFYKEFKIISFDPAYAQSIGLPVRLLETALATITVLAVVQGIQAVGAVLMAAMLITPAAAARYWTDKLKKMLLISVSVGVIGALVGAYISYAFGIPTGPVIIVIISSIAVLSMLVAPKKGIWARYRLQQNNQRKIREENILKMFYHLGEKKGDMNAPRYFEELKTHRKMRVANMSVGLSQLVKKELLLKEGDTYRLTEAGAKEAFRIVKIHRLWELYLSRYLHIAEDHVHDDAEAIEHVITPELEAILEKELDYPLVDPHGKTIEYLGGAKP